MAISVSEVRGAATDFYTKSADGRKKLHDLKRKGIVYKIDRRAGETIENRGLSGASTIPIE